MLSACFHLNGSKTEGLYSLLNVAQVPRGMRAALPSTVLAQCLAGLFECFHVISNDSADYFFLNDFYYYYHPKKKNTEEPGEVSLELTSSPKLPP